MLCDYKERKKKNGEWYEIFYIAGILFIILIECSYILNGFY